LACTARAPKCVFARRTSSPRVRGRSVRCIHGARSWRRKWWRPGRWTSCATSSGTEACGAKPREVLWENTPRRRQYPSRSTRFPSARVSCWCFAKNITNFAAGRTCEKDPEVIRYTRTRRAPPAVRYLNTAHTRFPACASPDLSVAHPPPTGRSPSNSFLFHNDTPRWPSRSFTDRSRARRRSS